MIVFAHRGASAFAPENTKASFKKALDLGAKYFEFDVQITSDNEYVIFHDYTLERTSNGHGLLSNKTLTELKDLDIGSWYSEEFSEEKIMTLQELIDFLPSDSFLNIELKRDKNDKRFFGEKFLKIIKPIKERILISSFDWELLKYLNSLELNIPFGILIDRYYTNFISDIKKLPFIPYSINPNFKIIDEKFINTFNEYKIITYTVNDPEKALYLKSLGVYGIFSNYPNLI